MKNLIIIISLLFTFIGELSARTFAEYMTKVNHATEIYTNDYESNCRKMALLYPHRVINGVVTITPWEAFMNNEPFSIIGSKRLIEVPAEEKEAPISIEKETAEKLSNAPVTDTLIVPSSTISVQKYDIGESVTVGKETFVKSKYGWVKFSDLGGRINYNGIYEAWDKQEGTYDFLQRFHRRYRKGKIPIHDSLPLGQIEYSKGSHLNIVFIVLMLLLSTKGVAQHLPAHHYIKDRNNIIYVHLPGLVDGKPYLKTFIAGHSKPIPGLFPETDQSVYISNESKLKKWAEKNAHRFIESLPEKLLESAKRLKAKVEGSKKAGALGDAFWILMMIFLWLPWVFKKTDINLNSESLDWEWYQE